MRENRGRQVGGTEEGRRVEGAGGGKSVLQQCACAPGSALARYHQQLLRGGWGWAVRCLSAAPAVASLCRKCGAGWLLRLPGGQRGTAWPELCGSPALQLRLACGRLNSPP